MKFNNNLIFKINKLSLTNFNRFNRSTLMPLCIKKIHPNTTMPFSSLKKTALTNPSLPHFPQLTQSPASLNEKKIGERKFSKPHSPKPNTKSNWHLSKDFFQVKKNIETEILNLFSFNTTNNINIADKLNLIHKFNIKIISGEISKVEQMTNFLNKARELTDYIKLFLLKNEYSENFMREISFDVFEKGFKPQTQEEIRNHYPNYFASNS